MAIDDSRGERFETNDTEKLSSDFKVCPPGLILPLVDESKWNYDFRATVYFLALIYSFIGVSVVTDVFMGAVVSITSQTRRVYLTKDKRRKSSESTNSSGSEEREFIEVKIWNDTVANLTLIALGTSAPEILLACVELFAHNYGTGEMGPSTIIGSAAFNMFVITAVCVMSIPKNEVRRIRLFKVFLVCCAFSIFAYIWVYIVLSLSSPHIVELWEAITTFLMFPLLVFVAFFTDKGWYVHRFRRSHEKKISDDKLPPNESEKKALERDFIRDGEINRETLMAFIREVRKYPGITDEDAAVLAASKIVEVNSYTKVHYRISAVRHITGSRKTMPNLSAKLQEIYDLINKYPLSTNIGPLREISPETHSVVEFHSATCAVSEDIGSFFVDVIRHGNTKPVVKVRVETVDGSAKMHQDYVKIDKYLVFESGETEKHVLVQIIEDNKWEPDEEFFLKLTLIAPLRNNVAQLGRFSVMEITIIDKDKPGVISFEKRGVLVKESAKTAVLNVRRRRGAEGEVRVRWRTVDDTAISGRDYYGGEGEIVFKHREVLTTIEIPLINNLKPDKCDRFKVVLLKPSHNATLGPISKTYVTITSDEAFHSVVEKLVNMTNQKLDSLSVFRQSWAAQIRDAVNVNGGDLENARIIDYIMHIISFNWKVMFSLIPPPSVLGGWFCFFVSLIAIGVVTALILDIATTFGCVLGMKDATTAITLVAVGTSLPDTFASRAAALRERYADTSVGTITGSNSVNVFLGIGLPWLIAAIYHARKGSNYRVSDSYLGFSVLLFTLCSLVAIGLLIVRRSSTLAGKAELGGPSNIKNYCGLAFFSLWVIYILIACFQQYGFINVNF